MYFVLNHTKGFSFTVKFHLFRIDHLRITKIFVHSVCHKFRVCLLKLDQDIQDSFRMFQETGSEFWTRR